MECPTSLFASISLAGIVSILVNLVDNAIRYTPHGGNVSVQLSMDGRGLEFVVRDDGPGIAPEGRGRVFERLYRIPGSSAQGSELGLAIVQRFARSQKRFLELCRRPCGRGNWCRGHAMHSAGSRLTGSFDIDTVRPLLAAKSQSGAQVDRGKPVIQGEPAAKTPSRSPETASGRKRSTGNTGKPT